MFCLQISFWAQIYDRLQKQAMTLLIPLSYFVDADLDRNSEMQTSSSEENAKHVILISEQKASTWINVKRTFFSVYPLTRRLLKTFFCLYKVAQHHVFLKRKRRRKRQSHFVHNSQWRDRLSPFVFVQIFSCQHEPAFGRHTKSDATLQKYPHARRLVRWSQRQYIRWPGQSFSLFHGVQRSNRESFVRGEFESLFVFAFNNVWVI